MRPIRHTSYPASAYQQQPAVEEIAFQKHHNDFKPFSSSGSKGKSHSYSTFEAPKLASNVAIDHSDISTFERPSRSPLASYGGLPDAYEYSSVADDFEDKAYHPAKNYADDINGAPDYSYKPPNADYDYSDYYVGESEDEVFDRVNQEEMGKYEMNNFRQPIKTKEYHNVCRY